jgi:hypothetical protein
MQPVSGDDEKLLNAWSKEAAESFAKPTDQSIALDF